MEQNAQKEREKILEIKNLCMEFPAGKKKTVKITTMATDGSNKKATIKIQIK